MPRTRNDYRRLSLDLPSKPKLYVIAAEGDKTEYQYFNSLKTQWGERLNQKNLHLEFLERPEEEATRSAPKYVDQMLETFLENNQDYDFQDFDELWLVIDTDDYANREGILLQLIKKCEEKSLFYLGLSNPCFEIWLILHYVDWRENINNFILEESHSQDLNIKNYIENIDLKKRPKACKRLLPLIHKNQHNPYYEKLVEYVPLAIPRAKEMNNSLLETFPQKVGTTIYQLLEKLDPP